MFAHQCQSLPPSPAPPHVISSGLDDLISIWDRSTGIKLYSIQQVGVEPERRVVKGSDLKPVLSLSPGSGAVVASLGVISQTTCWWGGG